MSEEAALLGYQRTADTLKATWLLQPLATVSGSDNDFGLLAGYGNTDRHGSWPWQVTARAVRRYESGAAHARWQVDGEIYPPIGKAIKLPLAAMIAATHGHTVGAVRSDVIAAELDWMLRDDATTTLSFGLIGYYDWEFPEAGASSRGAIAGLVGYWSHKRLDLLAEYDFASDVAGEDGYSAAGSYRINGDSSREELRLRGGWEKGDVFSLRFELGVPHNKVIPLKPSGF